jgi:hypothetical protein
MRMRLIVGCRTGGRRSGGYKMITCVRSLRMSCAVPCDSLCDRLKSIEADLKGAGATAALLAKPPSAERLAWALSHVRSRALRFQARPLNALQPLYALMHSSLTLTLTTTPFPYFPHLSLPLDIVTRHQSQSPFVAFRCLTTHLTALPYI